MRADGAGWRGQVRGQDPAGPQQAAARLGAAGGGRDAGGPSGRLEEPADGEGARVLVVGDAMLDRYWFGDVERISPEAPVPVVSFSI